MRFDRFPRMLTAWLLLAALAGAAAGAAVFGASSAPRTRAPVPRGTTLSGTLRAPGGPFLVDRYGRVVILHGVNVVYKHPPYEVYPDRGKPWNFDDADADLMERLGFNVVRLGIMWAGLEPGTLRPNSPSVCGSGAPRNPHQWNSAVMTRYLERLRRTVELLGNHHIYVLLDMHQDLYSSVLGGEGAPPWAVCTSGIGAERHIKVKRWSDRYGTQAVATAFGHFWTNDVRGDLQGQYDQVWHSVAHYFRGDPWVVGFDPFNEPFSRSTLRRRHVHFDGQLECFYTGTAHVGGTLHGAPPLHCPSADPRIGLIPTLLHADPHALVFFEPDIFAARGHRSYIGAMDFKGLVYNVHIYCGARSPLTGNPVRVLACAKQDARSLSRRRADRAAMASRAQPQGPAWFVSEFGATSSTSLLRMVTANLNADLVGWTYWSWKYYSDPTGSSHEALVKSTGRLRRTAEVLSQTYAKAIGGIPISMSFNPTTASFVLRYRADHRIKEPTLVVVPVSEHYRRHGYCAAVTGGRVISRPQSLVLEVRNSRHAAIVTVVVVPRRRRHQCAP